MQQSMSLAWELECLERAIAAARLILHELNCLHLTHCKDSERAPALAEAVLDLVGVRLKALFGTLSDIRNPEQLFAHYNDKSRGDEHDVYLERWDVERTVTALSWACRRLIREETVDEETQIRIRKELRDISRKLRNLADREPSEGRHEENDDEEPVDQQQLDRDLEE